MLEGMTFNPVFDFEDSIRRKDFASVYQSLMLIRDFHVIFNKELVDEPTALQMFQCFSQENLDLNVQDRQGKTFLMYACDNDYIGIIRYLCTHNADMDLKDNDGNTAFDLVNNKQPLTVQNIKVKDALCDYYKPKKKTAVAFAIALELDMPTMLDLLSRAEIAFSPSNKFDLIITYFITNKVYDIYEINAALFKYGQPILDE